MIIETRVVASQVAGNRIAATEWSTTKEGTNERAAPALSRRLLAWSARGFNDRGRAAGSAEGDGGNFQWDLPSVREECPLRRKLVHRHRQAGSGRVDCGTTD